jgi:single-stranded DNA-binding protein
MSATLVVLEGQLHGTPESKYTTSGKQIANFSVSVPNGYGQNAKAPSVFKVSAWEELAEQVIGLAPDTKFTVYGHLTSRTYEWQGQTKTAQDIVADAVVVRKAYNAPKATSRPQTQVADEDIPF